MKPTIILSLAVAATCTAATNTNNVHAVADLIVRAMDPATMDPTKLSVLSVLKTAMPTPTGTATDIALPTGDIAPQWYKDLPADVMVLLAQMYPGAPTATGVSETAAPPANTASSAFQDSAALATVSSTMTTTRWVSALETASPTAYSNGSAVVSTGSLTGNTTNGMLPTAAPGLNLPGTSAGVKNAVGTGVWSAVVGLGVAAVFCLFA